jgi:defect-in-organelle-trafficking protein DotD
MKKHILMALLLPALFLLASCSDKKVVDLNLHYLAANTVPAVTTSEQAQAQIAEASIAVGKSLQELSAVQMTVHPPRHLRRPFNPHTIGMAKTASIDWTGPVEPVLRKIAQATNYRLRVIGHRPSLPVLVSLNMHNRPLADILRNIMYQVVLKANIAVYPKSRTIELRYNGN